ncbi:MAG: heavy metal-associated domain-containing protein [Ruthenibacterium sp.]
MKTITLQIEGMMCNNCRAHVEKALNGVEGVSAAVNLETKTAVCTVQGSVGADALRQAVQDAGYTVTGTEE